jgi:hypothetical protein
VKITISHDGMNLVINHNIDEYDVELNGVATTVKRARHEKVEPESALPSGYKWVNANGMWRVVRDDNSPHRFWACYLDGGDAVVETVPMDPEASLRVPLRVIMALRELGEVDAATESLKVQSVHRDYWIDRDMLAVHIKRFGVTTRVPLSVIDALMDRHPWACSNARRNAGLRRAVLANSDEES